MRVQSGILPRDKKKISISVSETRNEKLITKKEKGGLFKSVVLVLRTMQNGVSPIPLYRVVCRGTIDTLDRSAKISELNVENDIHVMQGPEQTGLSKGHSYFFSYFFVIFKYDQQQSRSIG